MARRRGKKWYLRFEVDGREFQTPTELLRKSDVVHAENTIKQAMTTGLYSGMDDHTRALCLQLFKKYGLEPGEELMAPAGQVIVQPLKEELTLWDAIRLCLMYPEVRNSTNRERHRQSFAHVVEILGKDLPVKKIWIPDIKGYQIARLNQGASASTVNKEKAALSKMFQVLVELRRLEVNPAVMVKPVSEKDAKREAYLSYVDFQRILARLPEWFRPIAQTAYYTGMRRGEILHLTWKQLNFKSRIIRLGVRDVKERESKRVPIHTDLLPILERLRKSAVVNMDAVFLNNGRPVTHKDQVRWCWDRKVIQVEGLDPVPHFHDLRHTWKTNARRSGIDPEVRKAIMGQEGRTKSTHEGYGRISDDELVKAIDTLTFDHGDTEIVAGNTKRKKPGSGCFQAGFKNRSNAGQTAKQELTINTR